MIGFEVWAQYWDETPSRILVCIRIPPSASKTLSERQPAGLHFIQEQLTTPSV